MGMPLPSGPKAMYWILGWDVPTAWTNKMEDVTTQLMMKTAV